MLNVDFKTVMVILSLPLLAGVVSWGWLFGGERAKADDASATAITHVDAAGAGKLVAEKKVVVLDIRTPKEYAAGHIAGAINLDFYAGDFEQRLGQLDKSKAYLVHCAVGGRSTKSLTRFQKLQFQSVAHLDGGFKAWVKAGLPVEK